MPIERVFVGASRPALVLTVEYLVEHYSKGQALDLGHVVLVLPGRRAGRRLLEILVDDVAGRQLQLVPPQIDTLGRLAERLYSPKRPFATDLVQRLAWAAVLRGSDPKRLEPLLPNPPAEDDESAWISLAEVLRRRHVELAGDDMDFAQVADSLPRGSAGEKARWKTMATLQADYHLLLDELELWDRQTARLKAIDFEECSTDEQIVLVGTVDMNLTARHMLDQVASHVTALVFAPPDWSSRFDEHGCLVASEWQDVKMDIQDDMIHLVDGPADQAQAVLDCIRAFDERYTADEITVGFPSEDVVSDVARVLEQHQLPVRWGPGRALRQTGPVVLLDAIAAYLRNGRFKDMAALLRHPDIDAWLAGKGLAGDALTELDQYHVDHLQYRFDGKWLGAADRYPLLRRAIAAVQQLLQPLTQPRQSLQHWNEPLLQLVCDIYEGRDFDRSLAADATTITACQRVRDVLLDNETMPGELAPNASAADAILLAVDQIGSDTVPEIDDAITIELLGWLELPLDDAPALIVTSFNEAYVPASVTSDLFLPNALRDRLGLLNNARRFARDAYAMSVLLKSRESLHLIVARRTREGDPLAPSRLLFAAGGDVLARRALEFFRPPVAGPGTPAGAATPDPASKGLEIPRPLPLTTPISQLSVTSFRDYLACPYRFYLRHVLKLRSMNDRADELDAAAFGQLAHEVLRRFGQSPDRDSSDPDEIRRVLHRELGRCLAMMYGNEVLPVVRVQAELLRARLDAFALRQAEWRASGWRIKLAEVPTTSDGEAQLIVDGEPVALRGRIDRIDVHDDTHEHVILDYKTSDSGSRPEKTHQRGGEWVDLQLPLYRHLVSMLDVDSTPALGYIVLPKDTVATEFCVANWRDEDLADADEVARRVVRGIRAEVFWPPVEPPPSFSEEFAAICQDTVFEKTIGS